MIGTGAPLIGGVLALLGALAGLIAGSFIGVLVERWPRGEQIVRGRSRCDSCAKTLSPHELVPLLSYAVQRGRCRGCGARIPARLPLTELAAAIIGAAAFAAAPPLSGAGWALFGWTLLALALLDLRAFWLPDRLTLPLTAGGMIFGIFAGEWLLALTGAAIGWSALFLVAAAYRALRGREGLGGGDPKLFAAIGAWLGPGALPLVLLLAACLGLAAAAALKLGGRKMAGDTQLPFGTFLVAAVPAYIFVTILSRPPAFVIPLP